MAIPTVVNVGTVAAGTTAAQPVPYPTGVTDLDICVIFCETTNEPVNAISGWSNAGAGFIAQTGGTITGITVRWRRYVSGDAVPNISSTPQNHIIAQMIAVRGCVTTGDPWDATSFTTENVADTTVATPTLTVTAGQDVLVLFAVAQGQDTNTAQGPATWTNASLTGVATQMNANTISGDGGGFSVGSGGKTSGGSVSASTGSLATANFKALFAGALKAAPAPTRHPSTYNPAQSYMPIAHAANW